MALEFEMRRRGAERAELRTDRGRRAARRAARTRLRARPRSRRGELVVIDWGAQLDGYCSDCTRTVAAGAADGRGAEIYELVLEAQLAGLQAVAAGAPTRDVDAVARAVIDAAGYGRALRARPRPRRRSRGPRGPAAGPAIRRRARGRQRGHRRAGRVPARRAGSADRGPRRGDRRGGEILTPLSKVLTVIG